MVVTKEDVLEYLAEVKDPEIPVLTVLDMGIVRDVEVSDSLVVVTITPTYMGCPAMDMIESDIKSCLKGHHLNSEVRTSLSPAWTTDWITQEGKDKLEAYGIAPPVGKSKDKRSILGEDVEVRCPHCKSMNTEMKSNFGSTPCKALYTCKDCLEPFDYFKCI